MEVPHKLCTDPCRRQLEITEDKGSGLRVHWALFEKSLSISHHIQGRMLEFDGFLRIVTPLRTCPMDRVPDLQYNGNRYQILRNLKLLRFEKVWTRERIKP